MSQRLVAAALVVSSYVLPTLVYAQASSPGSGPDSAAVSEPAGDAEAAAVAAPAAASANVQLAETKEQAKVSPPSPAAEPEPKDRRIESLYPLSGTGSSFPLALDLGPLILEAHLSVFAQYVLSVRTEGEESDWFHEFELPRAHARLDAAWENARARVLIEAIRSASEGSLLGVAGDSFVTRVREAWASYTAWDVLEAQLGLVPTLTTGPLEAMWGMRQVSATAVERTQLLVPADLGATVRGLFPKGFGWVGVGAYNGEGYAQRELNRGKNIEIATVVHPLAFSEELKPVTLQTSYVSGSRGTALARADRVTASAAWMGELIRGGVTFTHAWGVDDQPDTRAIAAEAFIRVKPIERISVGLDATYWVRDLAAESDYSVVITGGVGVFIVEPLAAFLAVDGLLQGAEAAQNETPKDDVRLRVIGAVEF